MNYLRNFCSIFFSIVLLGESREYFSRSDIPVEKER